MLIQRNKDGIFKLDMKKVYDTLGLIKKLTEEHFEKYKFNYNIAKEISEKYEFPMEMDRRPWMDDNNNPVDNSRYKSSKESS